MFSKELEISIASLFDQAQEANIQYITVEHLLLTILNDYDVPCAPVLTRKEVIRNEQVLVNDIVEVIDHPIAGKIRQSKIAAKFSLSEKKINIGAPAHGENTKEILGGLGYSDSEIEDLIQKGLIKSALEKT